MIAEAYGAHLDDVATVQTQRARLLKALIDRHGLQAVYMEGLSPVTQAQFREQLAMLRDYWPTIDPDTPLGEFLAIEHQRELHRVGPEGRLAMEGRLKLLPAESAAAYHAANPLDSDALKLDRSLQEVREDAVVRNLLKGPPVVVVVFGASHDFRNNIRKHGRDIEYVRVRGKDWPSN